MTIWTNSANHGTRLGIISVIASPGLHVLFRAFVTSWALRANSIARHAVVTIIASGDRRLFLTNALHTGRAFSALVLASC